MSAEHGAGKAEASRASAELDRVDDDAGENLPVAGPAPLDSAATELLHDQLGPRTAETTLAVTVADSRVGRPIFSPASSR